VGTKDSLLILSLDPETFSAVVDIGTIAGRPMEVVINHFGKHSRFKKRTTSIQVPRKRNQYSSPKKRNQYFSHNSNFEISSVFIIYIKKHNQVSRILKIYFGDKTLSS